MAAHLHWRVKVTLNNGSLYCSIGELEFRESLGGADAATGGTATSTAVYSGSYTPDKAFNDDGGATFWSSVEGPDWWIAYEFPAAVDIVQVTMTAPYTSSYLSYMPKNFHIQWSDDGVNWTTASSMVGETGWVVDEVRTYDLASYPAGDPTVNMTSLGVQVLDAGGVNGARVSTLGAQVLDAGGTNGARVSTLGAQVLALDPDYVPVSGKVSFAWDESNSTDTAHHVYHATAPMDPQALPARLATGLAPSLKKYDHIGTFSQQETQYYRVGVDNGTNEVISAEFSVSAAAHVNAQVDVVLVTADTGHGAATNTRDALINAGFDANRITLTADSGTIPAGDIIVVCRGVNDQPTADKVLAHWANGIPVVWGSPDGFTGGSSPSFGGTFANLAGNAQVSSSVTMNEEVITDNTHYITSPFGLGALVVNANSYGLGLVDGPYIGTKLAECDADATPANGLTSLVAVEAGTLDLQSAPTPARSVVWPNLYWGQGAATANGEALLSRVIQWCLGYDEFLG